MPDAFLPFIITIMPARLINFPYRACNNFIVFVGNEIPSTSNNG